MNVYLLKDVENVGMAGNVVKVSDGFGNNFLVPRKLAIKLGESDMAFYAGRVQKVEVEKVVATSKIAMLAERIRNLHLTLKKKTHDKDKLYGSISADEVVALLKEKEISIDRKQVEFTKAIKTTGEHSLVIRLSSKLRPELNLKVVAEE